MKVLLIGNYALDEQFSMQGFSQVLLRELNERGIEAQLLRPVEIVGKMAVGPISVRKWLYYVDKFIIFRWTLRKALQWADLVHVCDHGNSIYVSELKSMPHLITCHDLLAVRSANGEFKENPTGRTGQFFQKMILSGLNRAQCVVCVTENTRKDLISLSSRSREKTLVQYNGWYSHYQFMSSEESENLLRDAKIQLSHPYLLHVGSNVFYKNRMGLLRIFLRIHQRSETSHLHLYMAGKPFTEEMKNYIARNGLLDCVTELSGLNNEHIRALYSRAEALVFPSLCEGFGMPIIEAQACNCPVFTSNRPR